MLSLAINSSFWVKLKLPSMVTIGLIRHFTEENNLALSNIANKEMIVTTGVVKQEISVDTQYAHQLNSKVSIEGAFLLTGVIVYFFSSIVMLMCNMYCIQKLPKEKDNKCKTCLSISQAISIVFVLCSSLFAVSMSLFTARFWNDRCAQKQFLDYVELIRAVRVGQPLLSASSRGNNAEDLVTSFGWCFYIGWISTLLSVVNAFMSIKLYGKLKLRSESNVYLHQTSSV